MRLDRGAFGVFLGVFVLLHVAALVWFYKVPFKRQQRMRHKDGLYRMLMQEKLKGSKDHAIRSLALGPSTIILASDNE